MLRRTRKQLIAAAPVAGTILITVVIFGITHVPDDEPVTVPRSDNVAASADTPHDPGDTAATTNRLTAAARSAATNPTQLGSN